MTKYKYELCIYITNPEDKEMISKYQQKIESNKFQDSGFDIFMPNDGVDYLADTKDGARFLGLGLKCCMLKKGETCGFYLYPRSSTGTKTPLRMSNSVGIIDSGYRGNITAVFDNISDTPFMIEKYQRLVQICPPNLSFPFCVSLVSSVGEPTLRGSGGFGSSGK